MKLAEQLVAGRYKPKPLPKPPKPETVAEKFNRELKSQKNEFISLLDKRIRENKKATFLDLYLSYYKFDDIFEKGWAFLYNILKYNYNKLSYFYAFLLWLQDEGFSFTDICVHKPYAWDELEKYSIRVFWGKGE